MALTAEELAHEDTLTPGGRRFVAEVDGTLAGVGVASIFYSREPEFEGSWTTLQVGRPTGGGASATRSWRAWPTARRCSARGRCTCGPARRVPRSHRGWRAAGSPSTSGRSTWRCRSRAFGPPAVDAPTGVEITTLAARPELAEGIYAAALAADADMQSTDPFVAVSIEQWRTFAIDRPDLPLRGLRHRRGGGRGRRLGQHRPAGGAPRHRYHNMTGVRRAWRGRGVAAALKRATSRGPIAGGLELLETENDESNAPMRAINRRLGYRPLPDRVLMRAPLPLPLA